MCTKTSRFMWFSGLEVIKVTSRFEELRLQGDQPHRGLHSVARGIQGISPMDGLPSVAARRGQELQRTFFAKNYIESVSSVIVMPLCHSLQRRNHGWGGCLHLLGP